MSVRYQINLSRQPRRTHKSFVPAVPMRATAGHFDPASGKCVCASLADVRLALPARLRKAFDRAVVWYPASGDVMSPAVATLRNAAGKYINTVYLQPHHVEEAA